MTTPPRNWRDTLIGRIVKHTGHFLGVTTATLIWFVSMGIMVVALGLVVLADWLWPDANYGNCWSFAVPRWWRSGGSLQMREADDVKFFGRRARVPHVNWVHRMPADVGVHRTEPIERYRGSWLILRNFFYFKFRIEHVEEPRPLRADPYKTGSPTKDKV